MAATTAPRNAFAEPRRFTLPAPLPPRPLQLRRATGLLGRLLRNPDETRTVFEFFESVGGSGDEYAVQLTARHPEGPRLFLEKPALLARLADRAALASLSADSFGRAYLGFAERNGFAADGLLEANEAGFGELNEQLDAERRWFYERINLAHDLWHVLTGYDTDAAGEAALLAFSFAQGIRSRAIRLLLAALALRAPKRGGLAFQRFMWEARRRGRRASPLLVQRYEELLPRPLDEVRAQLGITSLREAHPHGIFRACEDFGSVERVAA